jgi:hypothetical protein
LEFSTANMWAAACWYTPDRSKYGARSKRRSPIFSRPTLDLLRQRREAILGLVALHGAKRVRSSVQPLAVTHALAAASL